MMLADEIIAAAGSAWDTENAGAIGGLASAIAGAQRFAFSERAMGACAQVAASKPSSLLKALPLCRAPFRRTWFEWPGAAAICEGFRDEVVPGADRPIPRRVGVMIDCRDDGGQAGIASWAWSTAFAGAPQLVVAPLGYRIDWRPDGARAELPGVVLSTTEHSLIEGLGEAESAAFIALAKMATIDVPDYCVSMLAQFTATADEKEKRETFQSFARDLDGEYRLLIAMLCLVNSRNCVELRPSDLGRLNKARRKQHKRPLVDYSTVDITLGRRDARQAAAARSGERAIRRHIVRGHFKLRGAGVFWWRPYLRGSAALGQVVRDHYRVEEAATA